jgi:prevent-host-death family protein
MKTVTATEANRDFSKILEHVTSGKSVGITKRGKVVATMSPARDFESAAAQQAVRDHFVQLRKQPLLGIARGTRDELYD